MEKKICTKCEHEKDITEFRWKNKAKEIRDCHCKTCAKKSGKQHYANNKRDVIQKVRTRTKIYRNILIEWKETLHCVICGEDDRVCLDFHHVDAKSKEGEIAQMIHSGMLNKAKQELKKCVVVCRNCHSKIHVSHLILTDDHTEESKKLFKSLNALVNPLASNQLKG